MEETKHPLPPNIESEQKRQKILILLCWLVYVASYFGRYSYNSNISPLMQDYEVSRASAGLIGTLFSIAYGGGQIVNGLFCRRYNKKIVLPIALGVSAVMNLLGFFKVPFDLIKYLWFINGAAQSFLYSSLICILANNTDEKNLKLSIVAMGTTTACGTLLAYGTSALCSLVNWYKLSFLIGAILLFVVATLFFVGYPKLGYDTPVYENKKEAKTKEGENSKAVPIAFLMVTLCVLAVFVNFIKDGINTWMPTILHESYGLPDSLSIIFTLALPCVAIFATALALALHKKFKDFAVLCGVMFVGTVLCLLLVLLLIGKTHWIIVVLPFACVALLTSAINTVITTIAPLMLRGKVDSGKATGLFDGFCYLGSALSSYTLGLITDIYEGWTVSLGVLCGLAVFAILISFAYKFISDAVVKRTKAE